MALKGNYGFRGLSVNECYMRIERIWGSPREGWNMLVYVYASLAAAEAGHPPIESFNRTFPYAPNALVAGYNALRAEFANLTDSPE